MRQSQMKRGKDLMIKDEYIFRRFIISWASDTPQYLWMAYDSVSRKSITGVGNFHFHSNTLVPRVIAFFINLDPLAKLTLAEWMLFQASDRWNFSSYV